MLRAALTNTGKLGAPTCEVDLGNANHSLSRASRMTPLGSPLQSSGLPWLDRQFNARGGLTNRGRREKLLRRYRESDDEPYELSIKLSQEIGRTNRERREFSSLIKRQYLEDIDAYLESCAEMARGK